MGLAYIHLSDIHFGQEKGGRLVVHDDVKERLIEDVARLVENLPGGKADGIIVTGDTAYGGKDAEYKSAGRWLDRVAGAAKCKVTAVRVVPGNHDVDRDKISLASEWMLKQIADGGEAALNGFLENELDREMLYGRFAAYRPFSLGYDCPLDDAGGLAGEKVVSLAAGKTLRFIGLNSALICSKKDHEGRLILGARQRVLPRRQGEELVVLCHHPLNWLQDSDDARRYIRSRARVLISGHEHNPSVAVERLPDGCDLLMLASGAAIPPAAEDGYTFTYNMIEFHWHEASNGLEVAVHPRAWSEGKKDFEADLVRLGQDSPSFVLGCSNFKDGNAAPLPASGAETVPAQQLPGSDLSETPATLHPDVQAEVTMSDRYPMLVLRFFRDLTSGQRLAVLVRLGGMPDDWREPLTQTVERDLLDTFRRTNRLDELEDAINESASLANNGGM